MFIKLHWLEDTEEISKLGFASYILTETLKKQIYKSSVNKVA